MSEPCSAAVSGDGYWTCDVRGGCTDCRRIAKEIEDDLQITIWALEREIDKSRGINR